MTKKLLKHLFETTDCVRQEDDQYILKSKYKLGRIKLLKDIAALELLEKSEQKIFVEFEKLNGAFNDDIVLVQVIFNPKGKTKAKVIQVLRQSGNEVLAFIEKGLAYSLKEKVQIKCDLGSSKEGDVIVIEKGKIKQTLGNIEDPKVDEAISLFLYNEYYRVTEDFTLDFKEIKASKNRVDLRDLDFCTIDPVGAKDFDDAIYFDETNKELYVAIADVSSYVKEGSALDEEALKRGFSVYLPHKVLPMLPFELSNNLCSLVPNEDRLAYVFKMKLNTSKMCVEKSELFEATINSKNRYSYEEIDEVLDTKDQNNYFVRVYNMTKKFRNHRLKKGYDFRSDEIRLKLDENENLKSVVIEDSTPSHSLIEECMLLANQEAAKKLEGIGVFRVHDEPSSKKIMDLIDAVNSLGLKVKMKKDVHSTIESIQQKAKNADIEQEIDELIIQAQQQARYAHIKKSHFGLGFNDYSHFTSPIRRYADLVLHRILKWASIPKHIEHICVNISEKEREIAQLVWDYEDRKYARWAKENIGNIYNAKLIDLENFIVEIDDEIKGARVYIDNYRGEKLFTNVKVSIFESDIVSKKISGKIIV